MAGDDAVGPRVVEHVVVNGLDRDFEAVDLSTDALSLVAYLNAETEAVLVIDAAQLGLAPGDYRFFSPDEVETQKELSGLTTHEGDVLKVLELARDAGYPIPPRRHHGHRAVRHGEWDRVVRVPGRARAGVCRCGDRTPGGAVSGPRRPLPSRRRRRRDGHGEHAAVPLLALGGEVEPVEVGDLAGDGQAQPGAVLVVLDRGVGPVVLVEDPREAALRDADAVVADGDREPAVALRRDGDLHQPAVAGVDHARSRGARRAA